MLVNKKNFEKRKKNNLLFYFLYLAVTNVEVPGGLFRWGTTDDSSVLGTWHFYGMYCVEKT